MTRRPAFVDIPISAGAQKHGTLFMQNVEILPFVGNLMDGVCYDAYGNIAIEETK